MRYYPLFLDLTKIHCLVLGAGKVGRRKIASLQKAKAQSILVLDLHLTEEEFLHSFQEEYGIPPCVIYQEREFSTEDLKNIRLAFAATTNSQINGLFAKLCEENHIFCNVIEDVSRGDFLVPSHLDYENLILALSTSGTSPAFAKALKEDLKTWLDVGYAPFLRLMEQMRLYLIKTSSDYQTPEARKEIFRALVKVPLREEILQSIQSNNKAELQNCIKQVLPNINCKVIDWQYILKQKK